MALEQYTVIQLLTNLYQDRGVCAGAIGVILEVYGDEAYVVEFSREDGTTIAWFAVQHAGGSTLHRVRFAPRLLISSFALARMVSRLQTFFKKAIGRNRYAKRR